MLYDFEGDLPGALVQLPLTELTLNCLFEMSELPEDIGALAPTLKKFELKGMHQVTSLPPSFARFTGLTSLTIQEAPTITGGDASKIGSLEWMCAHMTQLTELDLTGGGMDHVCLFLALCQLFFLMCWA